MLFHRTPSDWGSRDGLTGTGSEELLVGSRRTWPEVVGWLSGGEEALG